MLASAASSSIHSCARSPSNRRTTSSVDAAGASSTGPGCGAGLNENTRVADSRNASPARTVTGVTPNARTISGASSALPTTSPTEDANDRNEVAEASSSRVATSGTAEASEGCETWCSTRTANRISSRARNSVPSQIGIARHSIPIAR